MNQSLEQSAIKQEWYPLSAAQRQLWSFVQLEPESRAYNIGGWLWLEGELNETVLAQALNGVVERHDLLRACFGDHDGEPAQAIMPMEPFALDCEDLSGLPEPERIARERGRQVLLHPFDLTNGDVFRHRLYRLGSERQVLVLAWHHLVFDAWSFGVFIRELMSRYESAATGKPLKLPRLRRRYVDFSLRQRQWLQGKPAADQLAYWQSRLEGRHAPLSLPMQQSSAGGAYTADHFPVHVDRVLTERLDQLSEQVGASRFTVLLAVLQALLARLSGQEEVRVGVPNANRTADTAAVVGFFVNNWVFAGRPRLSLTVVQWIQQIKSDLAETRDNGQLPFETLVEALAPKRHPGLHPLFQVAFNYRQQGGRQTWSVRGLEVRFEEMPAVETPFSLVLDVAPGLEDGLTLRFIAGQGVFSDRFMDQLTGGYLRLLEQCVERPAAPLATLDILTTSDRQQLSDWSVYPHRYDPSASLLSLITAQARRRPQAIALVHGAQRLSYAELEAHSNRLAHWLMAQGVGPETVVGLSLARGMAMIVGFLGILKAGGAFLPLDPDYPEERLGYMLTDSNAGLLLSDSGLSERLPSIEGLRRVELDSLDLTDFSHEAPGRSVHPDQLAYVIYTSVHWPPWQDRLLPVMQNRNR